MLEEFKPQAKPIDDEEEGRRAAVERVRQLLAALTIVAKVSGADDRFDVHLQFSEPVRLEPGLKVTCWPVTLGQGWSAPVAVDATMAWFTGLSFEALTAFFAFEVKVGESARTEIFVLIVELQGAPADRRERLLRSFLKDRQRLLRFLMFLLADDAELADALGADRAKARLHDATETSHSNGALLETLLRALHRTPERLDAVARLVEDVKRQPDCEELLPLKFDQIWEPIWAARQARKA